ncbi:class II aldolase/adducin family protein [Pigmentiphaga litoralis]|uniref:Ribulose-5-phosphate 4-epimerase/fuculose-1-phosphate aldolase n=1 Tax=Pigmentiphaga litoralis TaxID=516702 RepID=A0A7Y9IYN4_9BURK|nr:class II aldolase/adducin family protein [Pigmentiphaga litoralis]NYE26312.1 ribulose-5-phosphate 4-epimerase/fuculose-1-phosphate aldolase [Pigmentiphaga litoralis]NYE85432.1 ribulose-5-phosphate 4-epimerase/fuculose-1-phosphate aldolase [Pigmentiphaga litoralis]
MPTERADDVQRNELFFCPAPLADCSAAEWQARVELSACYRLMALAGITDLTYNHLSARVPDAPDQYLIKSEHLFFDEVTASSLLKYDLAGTKLSGEGQVSTGGLVIHAGILETRHDVQAVFHTHTPANIAVSAQRWGLLPISQHSTRFFNRVAYHDSNGFEFNVDGRGALRDSLGDKFVMVLRNHGLLIAGRNVPEAFYKHHFMEMACASQVAALSAGLDNLVIVPDEVAEHAALQIERKGIVDANQRDWKASIRYLDRMAPEYRT